MFYLMVFSACIIIAGSVIHNKMCIDETMMLDTFYILCTYLVVILFTMLLVKWMGEKKTVQIEEPDIQNDYAYLDLLAQETAEQDAAIAAITKNAVTEDKTKQDEAEEIAEEVAEAID